MKLHLILLASLFHLSNGFMVTITGQYTEESCSVEEYPEFESCVMNLAGGGRKLQSTSNCGACTEPEYQQQGHFCYYWCNDPGDGRRLSGDSTETAVYKDAAYEGSSEEAKDMAKVIIDCLGVVSTNDPCLPDTVDMTLTVTM
jgi:hypothetical protein